MEQLNPFEIAREQVDIASQYSQEKKVNMRTAAYILGVERVAKAMSLRGIYP